jgi:hypothetical protein
MTRFDFFIALDGFGLNGFEGLCGVARLRADPSANQYEIRIRFFEGLSGGHATQVNPSGTLAYLGNLSQTLLFYDPRTLREVRRFSTLGLVTPDVPYASQTHVAWLDDERCIVVLGPDFYELSLNDLEHPRRLGAHGVTVPHALKRSSSGRYLLYGAMDHDRKGYANQVGIFDLETCSARVVELPATVWHLGIHPERDVFYAPTQRCAPQRGNDFNEYVIAHLKNYLFEIDAEKGRVLRHLAIPKDFPAALTSDVVVTKDRVLYNCCASSTIAVVDLDRFDHVHFVDERARGFEALRHAPAGIANLVEAFSRANVLEEAHSFVKAVRIARGSAIDGSYGLALSPCGRFLLSAHRGKNEVRVYAYPELRLVRAVRFPSVREFVPSRGRLTDPRLGFHHATLSTASAV